MMLVSFIIANFNYASFVGASIESAFRSDWPNIEVIVVDDGSTDGSRAVIDSYGDRIKAIYKANGGQRTANNVGFAASTGEIIVFLDADDLVEPTFASAVANAWHPGVTKVQVQMTSIDAAGKPIGEPFPPWKTLPTPQDIRRWATTTSEYPTPPGSGNAYARSFLERFFPLDDTHDSFTDSTCLAVAPLLGDVVTVRQPLVLYRRHGANDSDLSQDSTRFTREVSRAIRRQRSMADVCARLRLDAPPVGLIRRSFYVLQLRVASLRLRPGDHPFPGDSRLLAILDSLGNLFRPGSEPIKRRIKVAAWSIATLAAPSMLAEKLIAYRFGGPKGA